MKYDVLLHPDEPRYWVMLLSTLLAGWLLVRAFDRVAPENRDKARRTLGWALVVGNVLLPLYAVIHPDQEFSIHRSLPLHFCGLNYLLIAINCFAMNRTVYTFTTLIGTIGALHSFLTPQLTVGDAPLVLVDYCVRHGAIFFVPVVMTRTYGFRFPRWGWLQAYGLAFLASTAVGCVNYALNVWWPGEVSANYMYMWEPPKVSNPLVMPQLGWPGYQIPLHLALLAHLVVVNFLYRKAVSQG
ncbi:MAG: hypothetical protein ACPGYK_08670 [Flavobacteriales bacterium]